MQHRDFLSNQVRLLLPSCTLEEFYSKLRTLKNVLGYLGLVVKDSKNGIIFQDFSSLCEHNRVDCISESTEMEFSLSNLFTSPNIRFIERNYQWGHLQVHLHIFLPRNVEVVDNDFVSLLIESFTRDVVLFFKLIGHNHLQSIKLGEVTFGVEKVGSINWDGVDFTKTDSPYQTGQAFKISKADGSQSDPQQLNLSRNLWVNFSQMYNEVDEKFWSLLKEKGDPLCSSVKVILNMVKNKDFNTYKHLVNVAKLAALIAKEMGFAEEEVFWIQLAGLVHDVGKLVLPLEILAKPLELLGPEKELLKLHVTYAEEILKESEVFLPVLPYVCQHHERCDGSGYPRGLSQSEMLSGVFPLIMADVVDAMLSDRPYRVAFRVSEVINILERDKKIKYPSDAVEVTVRILKLIQERN